MKRTQHKVCTQTYTHIQTNNCTLLGCTQQINTHLFLSEQTKLQCIALANRNPVCAEIPWGQIPPRWPHRVLNSTNVTFIFLQRTGSSSLIGPVWKPLLLSLVSGSCSDLYLSQHRAVVSSCHLPPWLPIAPDHSVFTLKRHWLYVSPNWGPCSASLPLQVCSSEAANSCFLITYSSCARKQGIFSYFRSGCLLI